MPQTQTLVLVEILSPWIQGHQPILWGGALDNNETAKIILLNR